MLGSLRDWPNFFAQSFKHLRPGGYIECQELDVSVETDDKSLPDQSAINTWCRNQEEAMQKVGMSLRVTGDGLKTQMLQAGFEDVVVKKLKLPIGQWPQDKNLRNAGAFQLVAMLEGISGLTIALWTRFLGWKAEDVELELLKVKKEFQNNAYHGYWPAYVHFTFRSRHGSWMLTARQLCGVWQEAGKRGKRTERSLIYSTSLLPHSLPIQFFIPVDLIVSSTALWGAHQGPNCWTRHMRVVHNHNRPTPICWLTTLQLSRLRLYSSLV